MEFIDDDNTIKVVPWLVLAIIALNTVVFIFMAILPAEGRDSFISDFAANGAQFSGHVVSTAAVPQSLTLLTSSFMHVDITHLFVNMYVLLIFGDNIEYAFGRMRFFLFYVAACFFSGWLGVIMLPGADISSVGASGAVAAVLGAYLVLYPRAEMEYLFFGQWSRPIWLQDFKLQAWFFILLWLAADLYLTFTGVAAERSIEDGIGYIAHVAGFFMGIALAHVLRVNYTTRDILQNNIEDKRAEMRQRAVARRRTKEWRDDDSWRDN